MSLQISRRHLLAGAAALGAAGPGMAVAEAGGITLIPGRRILEVHGRAAPVYGITQPDGTAGLFTTVGTPFRATLRNAAGVATLIHWHGLTPPYRQDGVPGISAPAVPAGGTAQYDFPLTFPGTFWMHSHQGLQEQSLMSAPLIVRERAAADRQEVVLMLHDFAFRSPDEIYASLRAPSLGERAKPDAMAGMKGMGAMPGMTMPGMAPKPMAMDLNDVAYDAFLANDRTLADPQIIRTEAGGRVLLRIVNAAASSGFMIDLGAASARLVAVDGHSVRPVTASRFPIAIAQRLDLALDLPAGPSALPVFAVLEGSTSRTGIVLATRGAPIGRLADAAATKAPPLDLAMEQALRATAPLAARPADRTHRVALTGTMAGYRWGLNGRAYGEDTPLMVARGQRVELVMTNQTMMAHPMHLHGHFFQVVAIGGRRLAGAVRDTVLVPPMQSVTVAFDADNPGRWAFHCHNLYHMEAGMMTTVQYETL